MPESASMMGRSSGERIALKASRLAALSSTSSIAELSVMAMAGFRQARVRGPDRMR
jgi:hypothetical protein